MKTQCFISFLNNSNGVFYSGQRLKCKADLITKKTKTLKGIYIIISGKANVKWSESGSGDSSDTTYSDEEIYFSSKSTISKDRVKNSFELKPGKHSYNFEFQLPPNLPTSFKGKYGQIHYEIKFILARSYIFDNEFVQPFTVINNFDLNRYPIFKQPIDMTEEKSTFLRYFHMTPFKIRVRIPYSGYVCGQPVSCYINAINKSKISCRAITIKLHRYIKYTVYRRPNTVARTKDERHKIAKINLPEVPMTKNENFIAHLLIPPTTPSSQETCGIIHIWYTITIEALMEGFHRNLKMVTPLTIGTYPVQDTICNPEVRNSSISDNGATALPTDDLNCLPTYEEAVAMEAQYLDDNRNKHIRYEPFLPKYPVHSNYPPGWERHRRKEYLEHQ